MFTGIIIATAKVVNWTPIVDQTQSQNLQAYQLEIEKPKLHFETLAVGESIAVDGVCLTLLQQKGQSVTESETLLFFVSSETLKRTRFEKFAAGQIVNLERSLRVGDRLSGHIVQGHVDGRATLIEIKKHFEADHKTITQVELTIELPENLSKFCIEKGSIAINGISLTLNSVTKNAIQLMIIPHTWNETHLSNLGVGDLLNIEVDPIAKFVAKNMEHFERPYAKST